LKENVIIGKLIPAGTGFEMGPFGSLGKQQAETVEELPVAGAVEEVVATEGEDDEADLVIE